MLSICEHCRNAAEGKTAQVAFCSVCDRGRVGIYDTSVPLPEQRVYVHKFPNTQVRCQGSRKPPVMKGVGHARCNGCPCQHRPSGAWNQGAT
jgi:hypothetical protein